MQSDLTLILSTPPGRLREAQETQLPIAHMAYRIGGGPHLFRSSLPVAPRGGLMALDDRGFDGRGDPGPFCREVVQECAARQFSGVLCDLEGGYTAALSRLLERLGQVCVQQGLTCYVPEIFGEKVPSARVLLSSALSGGTLAQRLEEAAGRFGRERVVLAVERASMDFSLPSPSGTGTELNRRELAELRARLSPAVFFSTELCAQYFTYTSRRSGTHFVLFDDAASIRRKLAVARRHGVRFALMAYPQVDDLLEDILR